MDPLLQAFARVQVGRIILAAFIQRMISASVPVVPITRLYWWDGMTPPNPGSCATVGAAVGALTVI